MGVISLAILGLAACSSNPATTDSPPSSPIASPQIAPRPNTPEPAPHPTLAPRPTPAPFAQLPTTTEVPPLPPPPAATAILVPRLGPVTFNPDPGEHDGPLVVSLDSVAEGAIIRYTTDGTAPSQIIGTVYSGPVEVFESLTIRSIAYAPGRPASEVASAEYSIRQLLLDPPTFELDNGPYIGPQVIEIINQEPGATIKYTLDGTEPSTANGLDYQGPIDIAGSVTVKAVTVNRGWLDSNVEERRYGIYEKRVEVSDPISLSGSETLEIVDTHYILSNKIQLADDAGLVIRGSLLDLRQDYAFQHGLEATGNSRVEFHDSELQTSCTGSLNWGFFENASLTAANINMPGCNTWHLFAGDATADITNWDFFGGTACDGSDVTIRDSSTMEIELCFPEGAVVNEALPVEIDDFSFPNGDDQNVGFRLRILDSSIDGWGIGVVPRSSITIRDTPAVTISIIVGFPWQEQTVELDGLARKLYEDQTWRISDATLRLVNTRTYGWEPNVFGDNTLIIRNSDYSGSSINSSTAKYVIENSIMGLTRTQERV